MVIGSLVLLVLSERSEPKDVSLVFCLSVEASARAGFEKILFTSNAVDLVFGYSKVPFACWRAFHARVSFLWYSDILLNIFYGTHRNYFFTRAYSLGRFFVA